MVECRTMDRHLRANRDLWDEWAEINVRSDFYAVEQFKRDPDPLDPEVLAGLGDLSGASVLHLQCHFGMDTLRLARLAREVVGVDFSPRAIAHARALAAELELPARFVESDVLALDLGEQFDVVFASYGVIGWLPALARWAAVAARHLRPGGRLFLIEGHPTMTMFDEELRFAYPYFSRPEPIVLPPVQGTYADPAATYTNTEYSWPHDLAEVINAVIGAGLVLDELREYAHVVWKALSCLVEEAPQRWVMPADRPQLPLMFSIRAHRPG
jgi:SAM-dependent methyltransferase